MAHYPIAITIGLYTPFKNPRLNEPSKENHQQKADMIEETNIKPEIVEKKLDTLWHLWRFPKNIQDSPHITTTNGAV